MILFHRSCEKHERPLYHSQASLFCLLELQDQQDGNKLFRLSNPDLVIGTK